MGSSYFFTPRGGSKQYYCPSERGGRDPIGEKKDWILGSKMMKKIRLSLGIFVFALVGVLYASEFLPGYLYTSGPNYRNEIALTFDDGPGPHTEKFLDLLSEFNAKATFFMLGNEAQRRPKIARLVREKGHEIGCHTWNHTNYKKRLKQIKKEGYSETEAVARVKKELIQDIQKSQELLQRDSRFPVIFLRMPHGIDRPWINEAAKETGFVLINWTYGADWEKESLENLKKSYQKAVQPGAILLFHDGGGKREKSLALTRAVLEEAKKKKYRVVLLDELLLKVP